MNIIYLLVPLAILLAAAAVVAFVWAVRRGQFDDLDTPGMRMLHDDGQIERLERRQLERFGVRHPPRVEVGGPLLADGEASRAHEQQRGEDRGRP